MENEEGRKLREVTKKSLDKMDSERREHEAVKRIKSLNQYLCFGCGKTKGRESFEWKRPKSSQDSIRKYYSKQRNRKCNECRGIG